jgi:hypothetical protein
MTTNLAPKFNNIPVWWHGVAMLPADRNDHAYHALRRVWGDHTMASNRGFYRTGTEDHITSALFQQWALISDVQWASAFAKMLGGTAGTVERVRWSYECNEKLDPLLRQFHGRDFIIPDIIVSFEDEAGTAVIACEVKKPGDNPVDAKDARKLESYTNLSSMRQFKRRYGCFIVSEQAEQKSRTATGDRFPIITWERLQDLQIKSLLELELSEQIRKSVVDWVNYHFAYFGVGRCSQVAPPSVGQDYASPDGYSRIEAMPVCDVMRRFLKGSECVEAVRRGKDSRPPLPWLTEEPTHEMIRARGQQKRGWQSNEDRYMRRWGFDWNLKGERIWK